MKLKPNQRKWRDCSQSVFLWFTYILFLLVLQLTLLRSSSRNTCFTYSFTSQHLCYYIVYISNFLSLFPFSFTSTCVVASVILKSEISFLTWSTILLKNISNFQWYLLLVDKIINKLNNSNSSPGFQLTLSKWII